MNRVLPFFSILFFLAACSAGQKSSHEENRQAPQLSGSDSSLLSESDLTSSEIQTFATKVASINLARPLRPQEVSQLQEHGMPALIQMIDDWQSEDGLATSARVMLERLIKTGGEEGEIDFQLPGNLVEYVVKNNLPFSEIITADYCVDESMNKVNCDTGAPFTAGVLTTKAFLSSNVSRYNIHRAVALTKVFACANIPVDSEKQPLTPRELLIDLFSEEAGDDRGNGESCYSCHGQFSEFTQLFIKFDMDGNYRPDATGVQAAGQEEGRSFDGLLASHLRYEQQSREEAAFVYRKEVQNLSEAASVLTADPSFLECMVKNVLAHSFGSLNADRMAKTFADEILPRLQKLSSKPTYAQILKAVLSHPRLIAWTVRQSAETQKEDTP